MDTLINILLEHTPHYTPVDVTMPKRNVTSKDPYDLERQILPHLLIRQIHGAVYHPITVDYYVAKIKQNLQRRYLGREIPTSVDEILRDEASVELLTAFERDDLFRAVQTDTMMTLAYRVSTPMVALPSNWDDDMRQHFVRRLLGFIIREEVDGTFYYWLRVTPEQKAMLQKEFPKIFFFVTIKNTC